ncbi:MAG: hypothetical protein MUE85_16915 [Microscillaceae bacterium]|jgi:predicted metal-dependent hydrolase|nr:hypothetical protein [Microscillaceae bacterium]
MLRRDYFLQILEDFAVILARIMGFKSQKNFGEAHQLIQKTTERYLKLDAKWLIDSSLEDFTKNIASNENYTSEHLHILADLLQAKGEVWFEEYEANDLIINVLQKSLQTLELINQREPHTLSLSRQQKIADIEDLLASLA